MPTFKRTMQDLDGKIEQEQPKEAPKPVEPKQYDPAKEFKPKQEKPNPAKSWELYDNWSKFAFADQTPENIEKGNKAAEDFGAEFSKHLNPKQEEEFSTIFGTFKSPDEVTDYMEKVIGKKPEKAPAKEDFSAQEPKQEEDEIERFDDEMQYSYDYVYKGLPRKRQIDIFAERMDITPERAKEYFDLLDKRNAEQKKGIKAKKEQEEKTAKANEQKRVLGLVEQLREAKRAKNDELAQSIIDQILNPDNLPF